MIRIKQQSTFFYLLGTLLLATPSLVSCNKESTEMTVEEQEAAKKEISGITKDMVQSLDRLDIAYQLKYYLNSPDLIAIDQNGIARNYDLMKAHDADGFERIASLKPTISKEEFRFVGKNHVLYTLFGKTEVKLKTGEQYKVESWIVSSLYTKVNNAWKIIYEQQSGTPPIKLGAKK